MLISIIYIYSSKTKHTSAFVVRTPQGQVWGSLRCDHSLINDRGITATVFWQHTTFFFSNAVTPLDLRFIGQLIILHLFTQMNLKREGGNHFGVLCELRITFQYIIWRLKEWVQKCILTVRICICVLCNKRHTLGIRDIKVYTVVYYLFPIWFDFTGYWIFWLLIIPQ